MKNIILIILTSISFSSYSQTVPVKDKIEQLNKDMENRFHENDMTGVAAFYLDTALITNGGRMNITGRKAIDQYWLSLKDQNAKWKLETESIEDYGSFVLERGKSFLKIKAPDGKDQESNVRFFIIWKKTGDSYKILYDVFTRL